MLDDDLESEELLSLKNKAKEVTILFKGTFGTELGQKCIKHLESTFVNRDIYKVGMTLEEAAFRQGEASVIKKILKEINNNG